MSNEQNKDNFEAIALLTQKWRQELKYPVTIGGTEIVIRYRPLSLGEIQACFDRAGTSGHELLAQIASVALVYPKIEGSLDAKIKAIKDFPKDLTEILYDKIMEASGVIAKDEMEKHRKKLSRRSRSQSLTGRSR